MESVESNQEVSAVVVAAAGERCADRVVASSLLIAFSFAVSVPSSRASFPRHQPWVFPARRDGRGDGRRRSLARGRAADEGRERRTLRRRAHKPVSPYENNNDGTVEEEKGATPSPPHKRSIIGKESSELWTGEGLWAVSRLLQR